ncbi:hypothetical protein ACTMUQ_05635 [Streptomyces sp. SD11]|uniref:hypothetical protein n=1 Tax=unclassified Streptomyces TaxID=2593676 RepID=UPI00200D48DE|nr:hypothetical protein [Streptomyces sp. LRE541]UPZ29844.1 hypothetical protein MUK60_19800 [Streptomyces sp. LRE541]
MERLRQAFLRFDRRHGGAEPPPRVQVFIARHPVGSGVVHGALQGLLFAWVLSGFDEPRRMLQAVLVGVVAGLLSWLGCRFERRRQAYYERNGGFRRAPVPPPPTDEELPVWFEGLQWICYWAVGTVFLWLFGQLRNPPDSWLRSAVLAGIVIVGGWAVRRYKERRHR